MGVLKIIWKSVGRQADLRHSQEGPMKKTKRTQFYVVTQGQIWLGWGWSQSLEGFGFGPANVPFPSEETVVIRSKAAACSVYDALEIACVSLRQHGLTCFLLTSSHCMIFFH